MPERIRLTISVSKEAHEVFSRMAEAAGTSLGKTMGDWLDDTSEGAQFVAMKMEEARRAPKTVMREFHAMAHGLVDAVEEVTDQMRRTGWRGAAGAERGVAATARALSKAPSSNTGLNPLGKPEAKGQKRAAPSPKRRAR